jgi:hypothetical protein
LGSHLPSSEKPAASPQPSTKPDPEPEPIPSGIQGWSWGAFLLSFVWAIRFRVWWGLLSLIPGLGLGVLVWLGIKGREMAWRKGQWDSAEAFSRVQRRWSMAGIALTLLGGVVLAGVFFHGHPTLLTGLFGSPDQPRQEEQVGAAPQATPVAPASADLSKFKGAAAGDMLKDGYWGPKIAAITPAANQQCMQRTVSGLPPLQLNGKGQAVSAAHGSHAENWVTGLLQLGADGHVNLALVCDETSEHILLLTSMSGSLSPSAASWLKDQGSSNTTVTVFDGQQTRKTTIGELLGIGGQASGPAPSVIVVEGDSFQTQGGVLRVAERDGVKHLLLDQRVVSEIDGDLIRLITAYRFKDRDTVLVTTACSGSSCTYTSFALFEAWADGRTKVLSDKRLTLDTDGAAPEVMPQNDGSLLISFHGFDGPQRWRYADGAIAKL